MRILSALVVVAFFFALAATEASAQQGQNQNQNTNVTPIPPRISRPARIRDPLLRLSPQQFIARLDVVTNTSPTAAVFGSGPDGRVSLGEFLAGLALRNRAINVEQATALFDQMDWDADGFITLNDFSRTFIIPPIGGGT